ncbi:MAG: hypothetical protein VX519_11925 [Myxococcota bacterium]|nr:hypothetical protein [Myxococcota bacterium]
MNRAAIDLGSNSVLLTVTDSNNRILHDEARVVGLGQGLGDGGEFDPERVAHTLSALSDYAQTASEYGIPAEDVRLGGTSATRRARDIQSFAQRIAVETGLVLQVISGAEEARLSWHGAISDRTGTQLAVIDLGGGSTEVITGTLEAITSRVSLELGSARLTERFLGQEPVAKASADALREFIQQTVSSQVKDIATEAIAVAGTATTLAAIDLQLPHWDSERVHGHSLQVTTLGSIAEQLLSLDAPGRRSLAHVSPERADFLAAGALVIQAILQHWDLQATTVSIRGLRFGILGAQHWPEKA